MIAKLCLIFTLGFGCRTPVPKLPAITAAATVADPCAVTEVPNGTCPTCVDLVISSDCPADRIFKNVGAADFHLVAGSPAIDRAQCIVEVLTDKDGNPRPSPGRGCDVGAYQFIPPINNTPPSAPTGLTITNVHH